MDNDTLAILIAAAILRTADFTPESAVKNAFRLLNLIKEEQNG